MIEAPPAIKIQKPKFTPEIDFRLKAEVLLEKSTIVHCRLSGDYDFPAATGSGQLLSLCRITVTGKNCCTLTILLLIQIGK